MWICIPRVLSLSLNVLRSSLHPVAELTISAFSPSLWRQRMCPLERLFIY
ncbi:MAG: hypothetical protein ACTSRH_16055 [Promethearchaeota archaeon]